MSRQTKNNPAKDIEELERRLKNWTWIKETSTNDDLVNLAKCREILQETQELEDGEQEMKLLSVEVQDLISNLKHQLDVAASKVSQGKFKVELLSQEAQNKILYKMDSEDIRSSLWKLIVAKRRLSIFEESQETYSALVDSLQDMLKIQQAHWVALRQTKAVVTPYLRTVVQSDSSSSKELIPIPKVLGSTFYEMKARARLCYEELSRKTLELSKQLFDREAFSDEIVREHGRQQTLLALSTRSVAVGGTKMLPV